MTPQISQILSILNTFPRKRVPLYRKDYEVLEQHIPIRAELVIKDKKDNPSIFLVDKESTIKALKERFKLNSIADVSRKLKEIKNEVDS